jgi:hypothetical protein
VWIDHQYQNNLNHFVKILGLQNPLFMFPHVVSLVLEQRKQNSGVVANSCECGKIIFKNLCVHVLLG